MQKSRPPVFIVGAPRSGTTLLTALLGNHSCLYAGPETQFFNKLSVDALNKAVTDPNWPNIALKEVMGLTLSGQPVIELFELNKSQTAEYLENRSPCIQAMLEVFVDYSRLRHGKSRWIEKTPNHILHLDQIRALYPKSPIIRIVRDPRDSATSICQLPWSSDSVIQNASLVEHWYSESEDFFGNDRNTYTIKYESLVDNAEDELRRLCQFINEDFELSMLDTSKSGKQVASDKEPWKNMVSKKLNSDRCFVWKKNMEAALAKSVSHSCSVTCSKFGYETVVGKTLACNISQLNIVQSNQYDLPIASLQKDNLRVEYKHNKLLPQLVILPKHTWRKIKILMRCCFLKSKGQSFYFIEPKESFDPVSGVLKFISGKQIS